VGTPAIGCAGERQLANTTELRSAGQPLRPDSGQPGAAVPTSTAAAEEAPKAPEPGTPESAAQVREQITAMIRKELPALTKVYNEALKKEADKPGMKKNPQKETLSTEEKKRAT